MVKNMSIEIKELKDGGYIILINKEKFIRVSCLTNLEIDISPGIMTIYHCNKIIWKGDMIIK
jgi:hypothetical protein